MGMRSGHRQSLFALSQVHLVRCARPSPRDRAHSTGFEGNTVAAGVLIEPATVTATHEFPLNASVSAAYSRLMPSRLAHSHLRLGPSSQHILIYLSIRLCVPSTVSGIPPLAL